MIWDAEKANVLPIVYMVSVSADYTVALVLVQQTEGLPRERLNKFIYGSLFLPGRLRPGWEIQLLLLSLVAS